MKIEASQVGPAQLTDFFLDKFVAHKISFLTECGAPELSMESAWLNNFILNSAFRFSLPAAGRAYVFNFIRRAEGAFFAYRVARLELIEFINTPSNVISPYFRSLLRFETCVSQLWQGCELFMKITGEKVFNRSDGSDMERLHGLYIDAKHLDSVIEAGKLPDTATASIWITNQGLEGTQAPPGVSFAELFEILISIGRIAEKLSQFEAADPSCVSTSGSG